MMPKRRFIVKAPLVLGSYFEGEVITADHHNENWENIKPLIVAGAIEELPEGDPLPQSRVPYKIFSIKATPEHFAKYVAEMYRGLPTNPILPQYFRNDIGRYELPIGSGYLSLGRPPGLSDSTYGFKWLAFHGLYHGLSNEEDSQRVKDEGPISFRMLDLGTGYIRVQARCAAPAAKSYFDELLKRLAILWPEVTRSSRIPGSGYIPFPAEQIPHDPSSIYGSVTTQPTQSRQQVNTMEEVATPDVDRVLIRLIIGSVLVAVLTNIISNYIQNSLWLISIFIVFCLVTVLVVWRFARSFLFWSVVLLLLLISVTLGLVLVNQPKETVLGQPSPIPTASQPALIRTITP